MDKLIVTNLGEKIERLTSEEQAEYQLALLFQEEQEILNSLTPTEKEMLMAEVEVQTITILMEVGLI